MQDTTFIALCFLLSSMDIAYTYTNVKILKDHKRNWCQTEYNPLVKVFWKRYGLLFGTWVAALVTLSAVLVVAYLIGGNEFLQGMFVGFFLMIHHVHYLNYANIRRRYLGKKPSFLGKLMTDW